MCTKRCSQQRPVHQAHAHATHHAGHRVRQPQLPLGSALGLASVSLHRHRCLSCSLPVTEALNLQIAGNAKLDYLVMGVTNECEITRRNRKIGSNGCSHNIGSVNVRTLSEVQYDTALGSFPMIRSTELELLHAALTPAATHVSASVERVGQFLPPGELTLTAALCQQIDAHVCEAIYSWQLDVAEHSPQQQALPRGATSSWCWLH